MTTYASIPDQVVEGFAVRPSIHHLLKREREDSGRKEEGREEGGRERARDVVNAGTAVVSEREQMRGIDATGQKKLMGNLLLAAHYVNFV